MDQIIIYLVRHLLVTVGVLYCTYSTADLLNPKSRDLQHTREEKNSMIIVNFIWAMHLIFIIIIITIITLNNGVNSFLFYIKLMMTNIITQTLIYYVHCIQCSLWNLLCYIRLIAPYIRMVFALDPPWGDLVPSSSSSFSLSSSQHLTRI